MAAAVARASVEREQRNEARLDRLLDAEVRSAEMLEQAKQYRIQKLQSVKSAAAEEVEALRDHVEFLFKRERNIMTSQANPQEQAREMDRESARIEGDYAKHGRGTIDYILDRVVSVELSLTDIQKVAIASSPMRAAPIANGVHSPAAKPAVTTVAPAAKAGAAPAAPAGSAAPAPADDEDGKDDDEAEEGGDQDKKKSKKKKNKKQG
mmetsp:Transcript_30423/g.69203  ORF Transcript_30423/g.69203 Transcript_30423/m.69203 type:complete len:208 (+) Transcript_30423:61-684(+)